jgi:hypothetical protein
MRCLATVSGGISTRRRIPHRDGQKWSYLKALWFVAQHIKASCGDHRLNRIGDTIVIRSRPPAIASGGIA